MYIGGQFTNAGDDADADYVAQFNGSRWSSLGTGLNNYCYYLSVENNNVYVSGLFTEAGGLSFADRVAYYSNGAWHTLDIDLPGTNYVTQILIDSRDNLYIGGNFSTTADGNAVTSKVASNIEVSSANANTYPFIQLHGPGVVQSVTNYTTGKSIQFDGLTLLDGEWINLILDPENIRVKSGWRGNCLKYIIPGSDIADFYLSPGMNNISVLMPSGTDSNSAGFISYRPKFWNIEGAKHE
jgi:hypothetical protein